MSQQNSTKRRKMNNGTPTKTKGASHVGTFKVKSGLADMLKGGVIMDVINVEQAKIAEESGAVAIMALERVPADIRLDGGVVSRRTLAFARRA